MTDATRRRLAWLVWAVMVLAYVGEVVLLFLTADVPSLDPFDQASPLVQALEDLAFVAVGTLGLRVVLRQPGNAVGWWIMAAGIAFPAEGLTSEIVQFGMDRWGPVGVVLAAGWVVRWVWILGSINLPFLLMLYPDGHLPGRRWRPLLWLAVFVVVAAFVATAFSSLNEPGFPPNPLGIPALTVLFDIVLTYVVIPAQPVLTLLALLSVVARYRRSRGVERQQVKVLLWVGPVTLAFFTSGFLYDSAPVWLDSVLNFAFTVFVASAITLAILRYRLFEIDRLISRTVSYAILAGTLAAVYVIGAIWLPGRLVGEGSPLFVAGSTLLVAALFHPVRARVMKLVERRFNRSRYDPEQIADDFGRRVRDQVDTDVLADDWAFVVTETLQPAAVGVWIRDHEEHGQE